MMPSGDFLTGTLSQLSIIGDITSRPLFGGVGSTGTT